MTLALRGGGGGFKKACRSLLRVGGARDSWSLGSD
jgi:hypothetical protein